MKYRIIEDGELDFNVYYPQFSKDGREWEMWYEEDGDTPKYFLTLMSAKDFIKYTKLTGSAARVVWQRDE